MAFFKKKPVEEEPEESKAISPTDEDFAEQEKEQENPESPIEDEKAEQKIVPFFYSKQDIDRWIYETWAMIKEIYENQKGK